jgi:flagella basal body P-ring formation protein FlgA
MLSGNVPAGDLHVELKPLAVVSKRDYTLGDIGVLTGGTGGQAKTLAAIVIGRAPLPGYTDRVTKEELQRTVRGRAPMLEVQWDGAAIVKVEAAAASLSGERIAGSASTHVLELLTKAGYDTAVRTVEDIAEVIVPRGEVSLRPRTLMVRDALRRRVLVRIDVLLDGIFYRTLNVPVTVQAFGTAWIARRELPKGYVLQCADLDAQAIDLAALGSEVVGGACDAGLGRLKRPLLAGTPLSRDYLQPVPEVIQGESIRLELVDGAVTLESAAIALTDGVVGQRVPVKPAASKDTVVVQVVAPGVVRISGR